MYKKQNFYLIQELMGYTLKKKEILHSVEILSKLKNYLPEHTLFKLYYTLVHFHSIYRLIVRGNIYPLSNLSLEINYTLKQSSMYR